MNIFVTSENSLECAQMLDDRRLVKMVLETGQLISGACQEIRAPLHNPGLYKKTHINHPCSMWVRASKANILWTVGLLHDLGNEYTHRYGKTHKTHEQIGRAFENWRSSFQCGDPLDDLLEEMTNFADCSGVDSVEYDKFPTVFDRYRECMKRKWNDQSRVKNFPSWKGRPAPDWY